MALRALLATGAAVIALATGAGIATADETCDHSSSDELASRIHLDLLGNLLDDDTDGDADNKADDEDGLLDLASVLRSKHESHTSCR